MSGASDSLAGEPFLILPGFFPDALGFAGRTATAMMLAYLFAFWAQIDSPSTAGVCVAIVAQPLPGMALAKAFYRVAGTLIGGVASVIIVSLFPQDRTMLLVAFTLWLGLCTFVAALLRDFRSYGAVLCGFTVGFIAISGIDAPQGAFDTTVNRVAATLIGVVAVGLVNGVVARNAAYDELVTALPQQLEEMTRLALEALRGRWSLDDEACLRHAATILALRSQASYAAVELQDGGDRSNGARSAIAALLGMLSASRAIVQGLRTVHVGPPTRAMLDNTAAALSGSAEVVRSVSSWTTPHEAILWERADVLLGQHELARAGLRTLIDGLPRSPRIIFRIHYDVLGAWLNALRTVIAVGLGAVFCILFGWSESTLLLTLLSSFTALLGMQPNPSMAALNAAGALPLPAIGAGVVGYLLLPLVSGFGLFTLTVAPVAMLFCLAARHPRTAPVGSLMLLYFALLLSPSNVQNFDLAGFLNNVALVAVATLFIVISFRLILPVAPGRRLLRLADAIARDLRSTLLQGRVRDPAATLSLQYDRLSQATLWLGTPTPARKAVLSRLYAFAELEIFIDRAWTELDSALGAVPDLATPIAAARARLIAADPVALDAAAQALLNHPSATQARETVLHAVSGLFSAHLLLLEQRRALGHYGILDT